MVMDFKIQYFYDLKFLQISLIFLCNTVQNPNGSAPSTPPAPSPHLCVCHDQEILQSILQYKGPRITRTQKEGEEE